MENGFGITTLYALSAEKFKKLSQHTATAPSIHAPRLTRDALYARHHGQVVYSMASMIDTSKIMAMTAINRTGIGHRRFVLPQQFIPI
jgi:hypothetical protein